VISWEFDRDTEDDDASLPAVYLVFDGYRLQSYAPRSSTPPSLEERGKQTGRSKDQTTRYREIMMAVGREPGETRRHYRKYGHQARDIDAMIALNILTLDGYGRVGRHPACPAEWRWWWEAGQCGADQSSVGTSQPYQPMSPDTKIVALPPLRINPVAPTSGNC
jgi:hypothetical protein